jgi:hypothetical protein
VKVEFGVYSLCLKRKRGQMATISAVLSSAVKSLSLCSVFKDREKRPHGYQSGKGVDNANQLQQWKRELSWLLKLITYRYSELISIYTV